MIRYAYVNRETTEPSKGLKGSCPKCGKDVIAKCGTVKIHHWAHKSQIDCDPWWRPMTQWHINWQNKFPHAWHEVNFYDEQTGECHRADIHTPQGVTIEFQNSALPIQELNIRNAFYKKIIWVVNAQPFKEKVKFTYAIPNPESHLLTDYNFSVNTEGLSNSLTFFLKEGGRDPRTLGNRYSLQDNELKLVLEEFINTENKYWGFNWKYKHEAWLHSECPVYLDFGDDILYLIKKREQWHISLIYLQAVKKEEFLNMLLVPQLLNHIFNINA